MKWRDDEQERFLYMGPHLGDGVIAYKTRREARDRLLKLKGESKIYDNAHVATITILEDPGHEVRHWKMFPCDGPKPPCTLVFRPKRKGEYFRRVMFTMPLYEGLIDVIEKLANADMLHHDWPAEWLYYHLLKLVQREVGEAARRKGIPSHEWLRESPT